MCIVFVKFYDDAEENDTRYIVAANRDEQLKRPAEPASFWDGSKGVFGGKDLTANGTWLALNTSQRKGEKVPFRFGAITNRTFFYSKGKQRVRKIPKDKLASRGAIILDYIQNTSEYGFFKSLIETKDNYEDFNILLGDSTSLKFYQNEWDNIQHLTPGTYSLSNGDLNPQEENQWCKCRDGKVAFEKVIEENSDLDETLERLILEVMSNEKTYSKDEEKGFDAPPEISAVFVKDTENKYQPGVIYATRYQCAFAVKRNGEVIYKERMRDFNESKKWTPLRTHKMYTTIESLN